MESLIGQSNCNLAVVKGDIWFGLGKNVQLFTTKQLHFFVKCSIIIKHLGVAQFGSALDWGSRCRRFKSCHSDHLCDLPYWSKQQG